MRRGVTGTIPDYEGDGGVGGGSRGSDKNTMACEDRPVGLEVSMKVSD